MATTAGPTTTEYLYPQAVNAMTDTAANYASGIPQLATDVYQNWYNQPLSTGQTPYQTQAWNYAMSNPSQQWVGGVQGAQQTAMGAQPYYQQASSALSPWASTIGSGLSTLGGATPYIGQAAEAFQSGSQYDPTQLQQFLNPYTQDAANATLSGINRNLTENLLPNINSTFTGAGQFGSSRNSEFESRALRDTQEAAAKALASANYGAYNSAQQAYSDWANKEMQSGQGLANLAGQQGNLAGQYGSLGSQYGALSGAYGNLGAQQGNLANVLGGLAGTGSTIGQTGLTNMLTASSAQQAQEQATLDKAYQDYLTRQQYPLTALQQIATGTHNIGTTQNPNVNVPVAQPDDVTRVLAALQTMQSGLSDSSVQSLLSTLFKDNNPFSSTTG